MNRDEFMELVYETFADEPDNVLANGIIEAADAYIEHEKAQLSQQGTTKDTISRQAALEKVRTMQTYKLFKNDDMLLVDKTDVQTELMMLPPVQPEVLACGNGELVATPEPAIPLLWIEKHIEWLKSFDNEFANLEAAHISVMVKKWRDEKK